MVIQLEKLLKLAVYTAVYRKKDLKQNVSRNVSFKLLSRAIETKF